MRSVYELHDMSLLQQGKCTADLLKYYGERKYKLLEQLTSVSNNEMVTIKLLNQIRKHTNTASLTIDQLLSGLESAAGIDVFSFKINGINPAEMFKSRDVTLEVYMNPLYFTTQAALSQSLPGFRKHKNIDMDQKILEVAQKEQAKWVRWFEKELNVYHTNRLWEKIVIEE